MPRVKSCPIMLLLTWIQWKSSCVLSSSSTWYDFLLFLVDLSYILIHLLKLHVSFLVQEAPQNPCQPSPCGPYSICREVNGHAVCSCQQNYVGNPPSCRPECTISADCYQDKACINQKCRDPCPGTCGLNAKCQVVNHNPICSCPPGYTGDPFLRCLVQESKHFFQCFFNVCHISACA